MLNLEQLGIEFGGNWLLKDASYQFLPGERIGLIGRNGAGKSTLLKAIVGDIKPSEGKINRSGKMQIAFFNQDLLSYKTDRHVFEVARDAFLPLIKLKAEMDDLLEKLEAGKGRPEDWDTLSTHQATFEAQGGPHMDAAVHTVMDGLGFSMEDRFQPYETFSGGWRMRVLLAKMLLMNPDLLLLDEPTNHLDLPSIEWLESYLKGFRGACIIVSHDRFFIDRMADKIIEISLKQLHVYAGNYSFYLQEKALRNEQHQRSYENQQKHIADQEKFINRFRYKASKARQVQSKIKLLDKLEKILPPEEEGFGLNIRFQMKTKSGKEVLTLKNVNKAYGDKVIIKDSEASVWRGDKIALIGANGLGKSTLLRIMAGTEPFDGKKSLGHQVEPSFFAQHQLEALNLSRTILEEMDYHIRDKTETEIRGVLGCFMFSGEEVDKKIQVLSGGEKSRVALAKTLMSEANFLLLDEPTNHLDIQSIQILVESLNAYEGTYVLVSHDRFFLEKVANKIWYIEDHTIKEYPGTYREFEDWKARQMGQKIETEQSPTPETESSTQTKKGTPNDYHQKKQLKNRIKKLQRDQVKLEEQIESLEAKQAALLEKMADPEVSRNYDLLAQTQKEHDQFAAKAKTATEQWEEVVMELEELEGE